MISLWWDRLVLTNAVFSRRRLHLIPIDFDQTRGAFQEVYDKKKQRLLGRIRFCGSRGAVKGSHYDTDGPRQRSRGGWMCVAWRGLLKLGCAVRFVTTRNMHWLGC